jgi:primosomal protein N' (replication factor Y) (superfamily II helicase)
MPVHCSFDKQIDLSGAAARAPQPMTSAPAAATIARVALDVPLSTAFDFLAPGMTEADIGRLVVVPFGRAGHLTVGVIIELSAHSEVSPDKLKKILRTVNAPPFSARDLALFRFCERYYHFPLGQIALNAVPPRLRQTKPFTIPVARMVMITEAGRAALPALPARSVAQRAILTALSEAASHREESIASAYEGGRARLVKLVEKGWAAFSVPSNAPPPANVTFVAAHALNGEQATAVAAITASAGRFAPLLLEGVTGSGKTEVYLHAINDALIRKQQALVMVPEINLSPAFVRAVAARFPHACIAELHSGMADGARTHAWLLAQRGEAGIVIGTRLAVFTPMPRLGLIVIDEEHDTSYKQQEGLRYSARDVAVFRAQEAACPVVLGSATPSLESLHNVTRQRFAHIQLRQRAVANATLPRVEFVDTNHERLRDGISKALIDAIDETVKRGEQALVFINRRGFAPALVCAQCGWMPHCTRCTARLVFHRGIDRLRCHHCGLQVRVPAQCADCGSHQMIAAGEGTERIESALAAALPTARMARVDRDSTRRAGSLEAIFARAAAGTLDVLVGTQMLSKGHDFPNLTLVGVVNADGALFSADFRAAERLAQQIMQVAGRAGRASRSGRVLIQTRFPEHPVFQAIAAQDYPRFAESAMHERQQNHLPPFSFLALLRAESQKPEALIAFLAAAKEAADRCAQTLNNHRTHVWDAVPSTLTRKAGFERQQLLIQADTRRALQDLLALWMPQVRALPQRAVRWVIDVDPQEV